MHCRIWHINPLQTDLRQTFELPEWPYFKGPYGPAPDELREYLQGLSIVRLELEGHSYKLVIPMKEDVEGYPSKDPVEWEGTPVNIFRSSCQLDEDSLHVLFWDTNNPEFSEYVKGRYSNIPDNASWYEWNMKLRVVKIDHKLVQGI